MYIVVVNKERQYSIWNSEKIIPIGWKPEGTQGNKEECLEYIKRVWQDIRPKSLLEYINRKVSVKGEISIIALKSHQQMIESYQKRYASGLDTWSNMGYLKNCVKVFFSKYVSFSGSEVFEIGIGAGISSEKILTLGHILTGIDVVKNKNWISLKEKYNNSFIPLVGDFLEYQTDKKYHIVLDNGCFHHFEPSLYNVTLTKIHNILYDKGFLFLAVFMEDNSKLKNGHVDYIDGGKRICKFFTKSEIENILNRNDFVLKNTEVVQRTVDNIKTLLCIAKKK